MNLRNLLEFINLLKALDIDYFPDGYVLCVCVPGVESDSDGTVEFSFDFADSFSEAISIDNFREMSCLFDTLSLDYNLCRERLEVVVYPNEYPAIFTFYF